MPGTGCKFTSYRQKNQHGEGRTINTKPLLPPNAILGKETREATGPCFSSGNCWSYLNSMEAFRLNWMRQNLNWTGLKARFCPVTCGVGSGGNWIMQPQRRHYIFSVVWVKSMSLHNSQLWLRPEVHFILKTAAGNQYSACLHLQMKRKRQRLDDKNFPWVQN